MCQINGSIWKDMTNNTAYVTYTGWQKPSWNTKTFSADQKKLVFAFYLPTCAQFSKIQCKTSIG